MRRGGRRRLSGVRWRYEELRLRGLVRQQRSVRPWGRFGFLSNVRRQGTDIGRERHGGAGCHVIHRPELWVDRARMFVPEVYDHHRNDDDVDRNDDDHHNDDVDHNDHYHVDHDDKWSWLHAAVWPLLRRPGRPGLRLQLLRRLLPGHQLREDLQGLERILLFPGPVFLPMVRGLRHQSDS